MIKILIGLFITTFSLMACGTNYNDWTVLELITSVGILYGLIFIINLIIGKETMTKKYFLIILLEILFLISIIFIFAITVEIFPWYVNIFVPFIIYLPTLIYQKNKESKDYGAKVILYFSVYLIYSILVIFGMSSPSYKLPLETKMVYEKIVYGDSIKYPNLSPFRELKENNETK